MNEILIDITRLLGRSLKGRLPTGVDRVSLAYIRHFAGRARAVVRFGGRTATFPRPASERLFDGLLQPSSDFRLKVPRLLREIFCIRSTRCLTGTFLVNTGHSGLEVEDYSMRLRRRGVKPLFMVHDLIPITHPEYCRAGERDRHFVRMTNALLSSGLIANSQATLGELRYFAAKAGLPIPPAVVAPLAPAKLPTPSSKRPMDSSYFVVLGTIEPRKNHGLLLQIWRKMIQRHGENTPRLVVIGQRGWECENIMDLLERCEVLRGFVTFLPACSDADLATYLYHAKALLFPSFAEGYGLPLTEALSLNVPVIASDLPVFREIAGDIPDYISPLDGMGWMGRVEAYAEKDSPVRAAQLQRISKFVSPTWSAHFTAVEDLLKRLSIVH
jgi:glycosyltransferase involved in cell wall biosynthesis